MSQAGKPWTRRVVGGLAGLVLVWLLSGLPCLAQGVATESDRVLPIELYSEKSVIHQQGPTDPQELEAFLDKFFSQQMAELHIPGVVFTLVKDAKSFFTKGYGYADLEKKVPVIPDKTLFRLASVSKLFTATAVMQLSERGKLNLNDDVNRYLKSFQLQENYPAPVTFHNLLTHTGGFDERLIGLAARSASEVLPLGEYLAKRMPPRVMPPGDVISYSNHGIALAGYLIEMISGIPFAQYIDENILQPLGMRRSSFLQPLPLHLAPDLAVGYEYQHDTYQPVPSYYINDGPAGGLKATAIDISRFMIAHLQDGRYDNAQILEETTARLMHSSHFTSHPRLPGWAYGFSERFQNNQRAIEHTGTDPGSASLLYLLPEQKLGFFVAYNNQQDELRERLVTQFLDRYYPIKRTTTPLNPHADFQKRADYFIGSYRFIRYPRRTIEKLGPVLLGAPTSAPELQVTAKVDRTLTLEPSSYRFDRSPRRALKKLGSVLLGASTSTSEVQVAARDNNTLASESSQLVEIEPLLFQLFGGPYVAFREDNQGHITHMFIGPDAFEKLAWYETTTFQLSLLGFCVLVFLSSCMSWPVSYFIYHLQRHPSRTSRSKRQVHFPAGLMNSVLPTAISALNLSFLIGVALVVLLSNLYEFAYGVPPIMIALLRIPLLTTGMTVMLPIFMVLVWKDKHWSVIGRLHYLLIMLGAWGFISFLYYWNLLGTQF